MAPPLAQIFEATTATKADDRAAYRAFQKRYRYDRVAFVHDCFAWEEGQAPAPYQDEILGLFDTHDRVAVYGPRSLGKTAVESWLALHCALTWDGDRTRDWKMMVTAGAWGQLEDYLWPEISKWANRLRWHRVGREPFNTRTELLTTRLNLSRGHIYSVSPQKSLLMEGGHADFFFNLFDEAKAVEDSVFDGAEGATFGAGSESEGTHQKAKFGAFSTPGDTSGRFYDICRHAPGLEDWHVRHVTLDECIAAGRISREKVEARARQWGISSQLYINHCEGNFAPQDADGIIPLAWIELAATRWHDWQASGGPQGELLTAVACDPADGGLDDSVIAEGYGVRIARVRVLEKLSKKENDGVSQTMAVVGAIVNTVDAKGGPDAKKSVKVIIDANGVGAGVASRAKEQGYDVESWIDSSKPDPKARDLYGEERPGNKRAAAWLAARWVFDPDNRQEAAIPPDDRLIGELALPRRKPVMSNGIVFVESKDEIRKRNGGKSTDCADPVVMVLTADRITVKKREFRLFSRQKPENPPETAQKHQNFLLMGADLTEAERNGV